MEDKNQHQAPINKSSHQGTINSIEDIRTWIDAFLVDKRSSNMSPNTVDFYRKKTNTLKKFLEQSDIRTIDQLTPDVLRRYLIWLGEAGHNPGGIHGFYRVLKTFLLWYEEEYEPEDWKNPIHKVKAPKLPKETFAPVELEEVLKMVNACPDDYLGIRDRALILLLLDTGARASEVCAINIADLNQVSGGIIIRHGKGGKTRTVYLGKKARKQLRAYLRIRDDNEPALFVTNWRRRLTYSALEQLVERAAERASIKRPSLHSFRRAFAINCLRAGMDVYSLRELMGHEDLQVLQRYLKLTVGDIEAAHRKFSPVDRM